MAGGFCVDCDKYVDLLVLAGQDSPPYRTRKVCFSCWRKHTQKIGTRTARSFRASEYTAKPEGDGRKKES